MSLQLEWQHLAYAAMLAFVVIGIAPLEIFLRVGVYRRWRRLLLTLLPILPLFLLWDLYAIDRGHWDFDPAQVLGVKLPGGLPLEELLFFLVVPLASVSTMEAVRAVRHWPAGDEPPAADHAGAP